MFPSDQGSVILLIGPSSVGKTAIASQLQRSLNGLWLIAGVDMFWSMLDERTLPEGDFRTDSDVMRHITRGWHRAVAALASEGNNVIVDELGLHPWWLSDWREILNDRRWWSVRLTASVAELTRREAARANRTAGMAGEDAAKGRGPDEFFDLVINTEALSVAACVSSIAKLISPFAIA